MRDQFQFGGIRSGAFKLFELAVELGGFSGGLADGAEVGPGGVAWDHAEMAYDGDPFAGHGFDNPGAGGAIDGTGAQFERLEAGANCFLGGGHSMGSGAGNETRRSGGHEERQSRLGRGRIKAAAQQVNPGRFGGGRFFGGFDMDMSEAAFSLELLQIANRIFLVGPEHGRRLFGMRRSIKPVSCRGIGT